MKRNSSHNDGYDGLITGTGNGIKGSVGIAIIDTTAFAGTVGAVVAGIGKATDDI